MDRPSDLLAVGDDNGLAATEGGLVWWHRCVDGWLPVDLPPDSITGPLDNSVTVRAPLLCPDGCGMHGSIQNGVWIAA